MSQQGPPAGASGPKPTIRLNLSQQPSSTSNSTTTSKANNNNNNRPSAPAPAPVPPASKKRRFAPQSVAPHVASAASLTVLHQTSSLHFVLQNPVAADPVWYAQGTTTLYVIDRNVSNTATATAGINSVRQLALHLRGSCQVKDLTVECLVAGETLPRKKQLGSSFQHVDPLHHVLIKPAVSYTQDDMHMNMHMNDAAGTSGVFKFDADAQSSRGAAGMTTGLRAASMASNMGELRLTVDRPTAGPDTVESAMDVWKRDMLQQNTSESKDGRAVQSLRESLRERSPRRRNARIELVAKRLADATCSKEKGNRAFKITIRYQISLNKPIMHLGGIHALTTNLTPHMYTTTGVVGDHEGPRCWIPCLDSAAADHRASHELTVYVTAPMRHGISCVGLGEDMGCSDALLHDVKWNVDVAKEELGVDHVEMIQTVARKVQDRTMDAHLIPPDASMSNTMSIDDVRVTAVWCTCSWTPVSARSLGFAVGPFKVLEDLEYFGPGAVAGDEHDGNGGLLSLEERQQAFVDAARKKGEGIRQVYFAPLFERKHIYVGADSRLLPDTVIRLAPANAQQKEVASGVHKVMHYATVGVVHRALSLMRDVLALPSYRTSSYTQVWIPDAVHGGVTSGALHNCPEALINPFLGGAILDARLLPPVGSRLPYYQGGRVLQFLQARCAVRGWVTATLPLGPGDDVGSGYIFSLIEAFMMSMYERGHGAHGEGKN